MTCYSKENSTCIMKFGKILERTTLRANIPLAMNRKMEISTKAFYFEENQLENKNATLTI